MKNYVHWIYRILYILWMYIIVYMLWKKKYMFNIHNYVHSPKKCLHWMYKFMSIFWKIVLNFNKLYTIVYIPTNCRIMALNLEIGWVPLWQKRFVWFLCVFGRREGVNRRLVRPKCFLPWPRKILSSQFMEKIEEKWIISIND